MSGEEVVAHRCGHPSGQVAALDHGGEEHRPDELVHDQFDLEIRGQEPLVDPELEDGLSVDFAGRLDAGGNAIGVQSSRVDWRAFVRYEPGAFDPLLGLSHGWKTTPRLTLFGAEMIGPSAILWRQDR